MVFYQTDLKLFFAHDVNDCYLPLTPQTTEATIDLVYNATSNPLTMES